MEYDGSSEEDLWREYGQAETEISRRVEILWNIGLKESFQYHGGEPCQYWLPALELAKENQLISEAITICNDLAKYHISKLRNYEAGIEFANEGLALLPEVVFDSKDLGNRAYMTWGKGVALENLGRLDEALFNYTSAAKLYADLSNDYLEHAIWNMAVFCHIELGQFDQAEKLIPALRDYFQGADNLDKVAYLDSLQAFVLLSQNHEEEALNLLLEAKSVLKQLNTIDSEFLCRLAYGYFRNLEYENALKIYGKALTLALRKEPDDYIYAVRANLGMAEVFEAMGKPKKAAQARFDAEAIQSRRAVSRVSNSDKNFRELETLRKRGDYQLARQLGTEIAREQDEAGNSELKLRAECEILVTLFFEKKYKEVLELWNKLPKAEIDQDDSLALRIKNMVVHALFRCNRIEKAKELCYQVHGDIRLKTNLQERAYAFENLAEIEQDPQLRMKHQSVAIECHLQADNSARAIEITRKLRDEY